MHENYKLTLKRRRILTNDMIEDGKDKTSDGGVCPAVRMADPKTELESNECNNYIELTEGDVYTKLSLKESDLALAQEVGQALLAENVALREKYERLLEVQTSQVEEFEQAKHELKLKCKREENLQEEKIRELNNDLENLHNKLKTFQTASRNDLRTKRDNVYELIEENAKLNSELTEVSNSNKDLLSEINKLQTMQQEENCDESFNSETTEADALQQRLNVLEQERQFLDKSISELVADKDEFAKEVDRLTQKVISLTEELADSKSELSLCEEELNLSRKENFKLHEQLEEIKLQTSQHIALSGSSLFSEISMLESETDFSSKLAQPHSCTKLKQVASLQGTPKPLAASSCINLLKQQGDQSPLECRSKSSLDNESNEWDVEDGFVLKQQGFFAQLEVEQNANVELRKEMCAVCHQLLQACKLLTNDAFQTKQTLEMDINDHFLKDDSVYGTLTMITTEMVDLLKEYVDSQQKEDNSDGKEDKGDQEKVMILEKQIEDLMNECFEAKKQLSSLGIQLEQSRKEIDQKEEEMSNLLEKINAQQTEIESLRNKNKAYSSKKAGSQSVIDELEKAKIDVQNLDNQLLEAINQKIKLSEQLEQWQYDMASIVEEQVQKQLKNAASERDRAKKRPSRLPFMKRGWNWAT